MEKSLDSAKTIHHLLILTSLAIVAFSFAPSRTEGYEQAIRELEFIGRVSEPSYVRFLREDVLGKEIEQYRDLLGQGSFFASAFGGLTVRVPVFCSFPGPATTVGDWVRFTNDRHTKAGFYKAAPKDVMKQLSSAASHINTADNLIALAVSSESPPNWTAEACVAPIRWELKGSLEVTARVREGETMSHFYPLAVIPHIMSGNFFDGYLIWATAHGDLVASADDLTQPYLKRAGWIPEVANMTVDQALFFLREKQEGGRQQVSILGMTVNSRLIVWAGPTVLLLLMMYLLALTIHIRSIAQPGGNTLKEHPWIGGHPYCYSAILTFGSTVLLPGVVVGRLAVGEWGWSNVPRWYWLLLVAIAVCGLWCSALLRSIRRSQQPLKDLMAR